jgi:ADP-ribosylglycohydrolase
MKPPEYVEEFNDGLTYRQHGLDKAHCPGMTTDDTQMTLAVASSIVKHASFRIGFADEFCEAYRANPAPGYGSRMRERLEWSLRQPEPGRALIAAGRDVVVAGERLVDTCGAAMRALPCGTLAKARGYGPGLVEALATEQARVTHHHPDSIDAAIVVAGLSWDLNDGAGKTDECMATATRIVDWPAPDAWSPSQWARGTTRGKDIVQAALGMLLRHDSLHKLLIGCVALGGDVDTLAALALGLGALAPERWKNDLPQALLDGLILP